jgi:hypothetical protein
VTQQTVWDTELPIITIQAIIKNNCQNWSLKSKVMRLPKNFSHLNNEGCAGPKYDIFSWKSDFFLGTFWKVSFEPTFKESISLKKKIYLMGLSMTYFHEKGTFFMVPFGKFLLNQHLRSLSYWRIFFNFFGWFGEKLWVPEAVQSLKWTETK